MLDRMTPDEFRERYAHYLVEPWGDNWEQTGTIAAVLTNLFAAYCAGKSGKSISGSALREPAEFIPRYRVGETYTRDVKLKGQRPEDFERGIFR